MLRAWLAVVLLCGMGVPARAVQFDAFEVATIRPVEVDAKAGRTFRMEGAHRWMATNFTLQALIALAYDLNPRTISGGPGWMATQHFVIEAVTPGDVAPDRLEQMKMLRALLVKSGARIVADDLRHSR